MGYEINVAANGRFVLPLEVRKRLGLELGGSLRMDVNADGEVVLQTTGQRVRQARRMAAEALAGFKGDPLEAFLADKGEQARREAQDDDEAMKRAV